MFAEKYKVFMRSMWSWRLTKPAVTLLIGLVLYAIGIKVVLIPVMIALSGFLLPLPKLFQSVVGRICIGFLITMSMLQIAATVQFLILPRSNFIALAALAIICQVAILAIAPKQNWARPSKFITSSDVCGFLVALVFLLPFTPIFIGRDSIFKIAEIGSIQAIDATNHYAGIAEVTQAQHLTYAPGYYYPKGFHIATGFIEDSIIGQQGNLDWRANAVIFFMQYIIWGVLFAYAFFALAVRFLERFGKIPKTSLRLLLAACLAPVVAILYILPMVNEGFLNYYYVLTTIFIALVFLLELKDTFVLKADHMLQDGMSRWLIFTYLILVFGASVSWPLLIPPILLIGFITISNDRMRLPQLLRSFWTVSALPILGALLLQFIPIYFQLHYSSADASQGINLTGGLKEFHALLLLAGAIVVTIVVFGNKLQDSYRRQLLAIFLPLILFIGLLVAMQYFTVTEIRYYVIKSSWLLEMLLVAFSMAAFVYAVDAARFVIGKFAFLVPAIPFCVVLMLISVVNNPLKDVRDLFRNYSHELKPDFFDHDVSVYAKLGSDGKIKHFNSTLLHYNQQQGKFYAHEQLTYWSNMMQYDASSRDFLALNCAGALYSNVAFGTFTPPEQLALIAKVEECIGLAQTKGADYYIVTDQASAPMIRKTFGKLVKIVY